MKKLLFLVVAVFLSVVVGCGKYADEEKALEVSEEPGGSSVAMAEEFRLFGVYIDKGSGENHFIPSGWMGDVNDVEFSDMSRENPHSGKTCIKVVYLPNASGGNRWVGIYWQSTANNWGNKKGGYDLTGATKLTFWARGDKGGERVEEFKLGGITGTYPDSDIAGIGPVILTNEWQEYKIDLGGKDLSYINGGFGWATNLDVNPEGCTFYIDDIVYE
ncbi:hypothetical protein ACFL1E_01780 [Candidatus Omnitrophota bacterium]